jgi:hypothetical protein
LGFAEHASFPYSFLMGAAGAVAVVGAELGLAIAALRASPTLFPAAGGVTQSDNDFVERLLAAWVIQLNLPYPQILKLFQISRKSRKKATNADKVARG